MSGAREQYLKRLGITQWVPRHATVTATAAVEVAPAAQPEAVPPEAPSTLPPSDWKSLEAAVAACTACALHGTRTQTVFGVGRRDADWMVIGEAPGAEEDRQGEPFVGPAGQLLDRMLQASGYQRSEVFIANILKCRPPNNRDPRPEEAAACRSFLEQQIQWVQPKLILCVGRIAAQNLLGTDETIGKLRGRVHRHAASGTPVVVTYHPAYLLRDPAEKRKAWEDLKLAMRVTAGGAA